MWNFKIFIFLDILYTFRLTFSCHAKEVDNGKSKRFETNGVPNGLSYNSKLLIHHLERNTINATKNSKRNCSQQY